MRGNDRPSQLNVADYGAYSLRYGVSPVTFKARCTI
ncbi:hypothetical protein YM18_3237 [Geobacter sulfurreducens]|nr:hypothetical protein YM18_3237 [Geobacter sulfurreducens]